MVTTETDALAEGLDALRASAQIPTNFAMITGLVAGAVVEAFDDLQTWSRAKSHEIQFLRSQLRGSKDALRTAQEGLLHMERVNNNLAADQEQHSDRDEVSAVITGQLADDLDRAEHEVYDLLTAVNFYRGLAINGTRINSVTDAAFLTALDIEL